IGEQLTGLSQAALVEGVRVLRPLQPDVDGARETAGAGAREVAHMRHQAGGWMYRTGASHGDEKVAGAHGRADIIHAFGDLSEPDHVRTQQITAFAARRSFQLGLLVGKLWPVPSVVVRSKLVS